MSTLRLPAHFLTTASYHHRAKNPYSVRYETGGYLFADRDEPDTVAGATGPGADSEHTEASVYISRDDIERAVETAGYVLAGCWHSHSPVATTEPSPDDRAAWRADLQRSPRLTSWASVILRHDGERWADIAAWRTTRQGSSYTCEPVTPTPGLTNESRELAASLAFHVNRTALVEPWTWTREPTRLRRDLAVLDASIQTHQLVRLQELNDRLERLGIRGNLKPLTPTPAHRSAGANEIVIHGGGIIRRPGCGRVLGVR